MKCSKIKSRYTNSYRKLILLSVFLWNPIIAFSQSGVPQNFNQQLDQILTDRPAGFQALKSELHAFSEDSIAMKVMVQKSQSVNYLEGTIYAINALGVIYRNVSLYQKSIEKHIEAARLAEQLKNTELTIISLNNVGVAFRRMDLVKPALDYHAKALDMGRAVENPNDVITYNIAVSQNSIGNIYLILEQYDLAIKQFQKSLTIEKETGNRLGLAINHQNIGFAYEAKGQFETALRNFKLSLDYNNQIDSNLGRVICYNSIGEVYIKQKKLDDAKIIIQKALNKALSIGDQFYIALSYINLGWILEEMGQFKASEEYLKKGMSVAKAYSLNLSEVEAGKHLADLYKKSGKHDQAYQYYKNAVELEKTINNDNNLRYVNDVMIQYENTAKNREIAELANENQLVKSKLERNKTIFWYSILILAIIAASLIFIYRNRRLLQEKQILTLEQDMLRSQMNPHFIFNSLNSIKLYIINNEKENAVYYLNKFSKLIRKILVASSEKESTLEDELDTMQLYMNIENIRFSNEIAFRISVADEINTSIIKVPSLMLQPFLENALWHGLSSKKDDKTITLDVYRASEDFINIAITDNGVGRKQAQKINNDKLLKRKSVGIAITKARLSNFSKGYTSEYSITIDDLFDNEDRPIGTRVLVKIPTIKTSFLKTA